MSRAAFDTATRSGRPYVSKSKFLWGHQCRKLLWYAYNQKDQIPAPDAATQAIFDQGHEVGALAKSLYPGGIEVSADVTDFEQVLQASLEAAKQRKPLFEAGFVYNGGFARVDILEPVGRDAWDIIEVKSSTEVKDVNLLDLAFQAFVYDGSGLNIRRCYLMHVDRDYVRRGPVDPRKFFKLADVTKDVSVLSREIEPQLEDMFSIIHRMQEPEIKMSSVGQTDPSRVEMKGFKMTHLDRGCGAANRPRIGRICGRYGEHTPGARARSNIESGAAGLAHPADRARTEGQPQYRACLRAPAPRSERGSTH
jgi:hypothetical protein